MPWGVAAAVVVGAISASEQSKSAKRASEAQERSAAAAVEEQKRQFQVSQVQADPFREAGIGALEQQQALLGLSGAGTQERALAAFQESPGQAFLRERGEQALLRSSSAIGGLGGGQIRTALQQQGIGFAQQDLQNQLARLGGIAGQGQVATSNIAQLGAGTSANIGNLLQAGGQAQASGILGAQQAQSQFAGQIGSGLVGGTMGAQTEGSSFSQGFTTGLARL